MDIVILIATIVIICFALVIPAGAPYVPTLNKDVHNALETLNLKPGQILLELGCGDGKVLKAAASTGVYAVGIELNPLLVIIARLRTWRHRKYVRVLWGNLWNTSRWPAADGVFIFILPKYMARIDEVMKRWHKKPLRLVSFGFPIPEKKIAQESNGGIYLYEY